MRNAVILAAVLMMATGANGQTPAPATAGAAAPAVELKVGDQAPDFTLQASDGKTYKLSDFKGKKAVVVAWFPKAFTSGCTIECKSLAENGDKIRKYNVAYFMASVDPLEDNKGFAEKEKADFPLLSDPTKETAKRLRRAQRERLRQPLDVLHRQGRQDPRHRQGRQAGDVGRGHGRQARRVRRRAGEVKPGGPNFSGPHPADRVAQPFGTSLISNSFGHNFPVTNSRSPFAS